MYRYPAVSVGCLIARIGSEILPIVLEIRDRWGVGGGPAAGSLLSVPGCGCSVGGSGGLATRQQRCWLELEV